MNQIIETQTASGSVDPLAQICAALGHWPPTAEEIEKNRARKAEIEFQSQKRRLENQDRKRAEMKERAREVIRRNRDEQV